MSLLFPLYALGLLALAIPIYLHLQRRPPSDSVEFSSLRFLKPARQVRINRRSKLEHLALLALRCLALLLLAFIFSRPFLKDSDALADSDGTRSVLLVDTSASMRRAGLWTEAEKRVDQQLDAIEATRDRLAIIAYDDTVRPLLSFEQWDKAPAEQRLAIARAAIDGLEPSWRGSDLGAALAEANDLLQDDASEQLATVVLVSDMQQGSNLDAVNGTDWSPEIALVPDLVEAEDGEVSQQNAALHRLPGRVPRLRLVNSGEAGSFTLGWAGDTNKQTIAVDAERSRVLPLPEFAGATASSSTGGELVLEGDNDDFDNRVFIAPRAALPIHLQYLGPRSSTDADNPYFYFKRAFPESGDLAPVFLPAETFADEPGRADLLVVADALDPAPLQQVRDELASGRNALLVMHSTRMAPTLGKLIGVPDLKATERTPKDYALFEDIDFDHPALRAFTEATVRDFTKVHVWRYRKLDPAAFPEGTRMIASFDAGASEDDEEPDPAWLEVPVGDGRLFVMATGWHPRDSLLARSSKFLPLCFSLLEYGGRNTDLKSALAVGDPLPWRDHLQGGRAAEAEKTTLTRPGGESEELTPDTRVVADVPGLYTVVSGDRSVTYAANLPASESRLDPIAPDRFASLGIPYGKGAAVKAERSGEKKKDLATSELESKQKFWRFLILALFLILLVETFLGSRTRGDADKAADAEVGEVGEVT